MFLLGLCVLVPGLFHVASGTGTIDIHFIRYSDNCVEDLGTNLCDPMFSFCLSTPQKGPSLTVNNCNYASTGESPNHFHNTNNIDLEHSTSIGGHRNPWEVQIPAFIDPLVMIIIMVRDADIFEHDHLQTMGKVLNETIWPSKEKSMWADQVLSQNSYTMRFRVRMYCDANYFTTKCDKYCKADNSTTGHHVCEQITGNKICLPGWQGTSCYEDVDECTLGYCNMGNCTNLPGDYNCRCPTNYTGKNCSVLMNPCHSNSCQNGGACFAHSAEYVFFCNCTQDWEGTVCDVRKNLCQSEPCLNNGSCINSQNGTGYNCSCVYPYDGDHCEVVGETVTQNIETTSLDTSFTSSPSTETSSPTITNTTAAPITSTTAATIESSTSTISELSGENMQQIRRKDEDNDFKLWYIAIIVGIMLILLAVVATLFIKRRQRKAALHLTPPNSPVVFYNGANLTFDNSAYSDVNRNNLDTERQTRQLPAVPSLPTTPTEDELFNPRKPSYVEMDETGAKGGITNDYREMKKKSVSSDMNTLHVRPVSERAQANPYADFKDLTDLQKEEEKADKPQEESHYHDLFDIANSMQEIEEAAEQVDPAEAIFNYDFQAAPMVTVLTSPYESPPNNASYYATPPPRSTMLTPRQPESIYISSSPALPYSDHLIRSDSPTANPKHIFPSSKNLATVADDLCTDSSDDDDDGHVMQEDLAKLRQDVKNKRP